MTSTPIPTPPTGETGIPGWLDNASCRVQWRDLVMGGVTNGYTAANEEAPAAEREIARRRSELTDRIAETLRALGPVFAFVVEQGKRTSIPAPVYVVLAEAQPLFLAILNPEEPERPETYEHADVWAAAGMLTVLSSSPLVEGELAEALREAGPAIGGVQALEDAALEIDALVHPEGEGAIAAAAVAESAPAEAVAVSVGVEDPPPSFYAARRAGLEAEIRTPAERDRHLPPVDEVERRMDDPEYEAWDAAREVPTALAWMEPLTLLRNAWDGWDDVLAVARAWPVGEADPEGGATLDPEVMRLIEAAHEMLGTAIQELTGTQGKEGNDAVAAVECARAAEGFMLAVRWGFGWMVSNLVFPSTFPAEVFEKVCIVVSTLGPNFGDRVAKSVATMGERGVL